MKELAKTFGRSHSRQRAGACASRPAASSPIPLSQDTSARRSARPDLAPLALACVRTGYRLFTGAAIVIDGAVADDWFEPPELGSCDL